MPFHTRRIFTKCYTCHAKKHSHNAPRLPEFVCWHHLTLAWQCDSQKTRNATRLKCCTRHAKWRWGSPKWYACHEKCNSSSENLAKVSRLSHKTILDAFADTWECQQVPRLPRKTAWQLVLKPSKMTGLAASLIDTATAEENQRIETRHVGASKRAFPARLPQIFTLRSFKIDMFPRVLSWTSKFATSKSMFRERFNGNFHHMSQNATPATEFARCHHFAQPWHCDSQKKQATQHVWTATPATQNDNGVLQSAVPAPKNAPHLLKTTRKYCAMPRKTIFDTLWNMLECHKVPRLPLETRLRDDWNFQKWTFLQNSP